MSVHKIYGAYRNNLIYFLCRNFGEGLYEMCCTLPFDIKVFQNDATVPYKYLLYSGRSKEDRKPHEWLHGAVSRGNQVVNRCLCIPKEKSQRGGIIIMCIV